MCRIIHAPLRPVKLTPLSRGEKGPGVSHAGEHYGIRLQRRVLRTLTWGWGLFTPEAGVMTRKHSHTTDRMANFVRCVVLITVYAMTALANDRRSLPILHPLLAALAVYTVATTMMSRHRALSRQESLTITSMDVVLITCLVWFTGGPSSQYYVLYYLPILHASLRLNFRDAIGSAALSSGFYTLMGIAAPEQMASSSQAAARIGTFGCSAAILAGFFALTAKHFRIHRESEKRMRAAMDRLAAVYDVGRMATQGGSTRDILEALVTQAMALCKAQSSAAALLSEDGSMQVIADAHNGTHDASVGLDAGLAKQAVASLAPVFCSEKGERDQGGSTVCIPLRSNGRALGVLQASCPAGRAFTQSEVDLLSALCAEACTGLENARLRAELARTAATDYLTGLPNRREFERLLAEEMSRCKSRNTGLALVLLDVDEFKQCNDLKGHAAGDEVLKALAAAIRDASTEADSAARYGGDEFALLLPGKGAGQAVEVAEKVRQNFKKRLKAIDPSLAHVTLSAGVGCHHYGASLEDLVQEADRAVLRAKREGRDRVCLAHICEDEGA